jgi:tetratricopeptide (TPR) repeat protein
MRNDKRLESLRARSADDPAGVKAEILNELAVNRKAVTEPSRRVRFYGLLVACCRHLCDFAGGLQVLGIAKTIGGSPAARAELLAQGASLHIERRDGDSACDAIEASLELVRGELAKSEGTSPDALKLRQQLLVSKAAYLVIRAEIATHLKVGSPSEAMADALEALGLASHKSALRVQMAATTLLTTLLTRFGTLRDVTQALALLDQADKELARRRVRRSHGHRVRIRWGKALALARLGMIDRAEHIMAEVIEKLIAAGARQDAENAVEALAWIVEERAGKQGRADYLRRRYRARMDAGVDS